MDKLDNGVAVATSVQKVGLINFADGFIFLKSEDTKTLGKKLLQVWTNLTTVLLVEGKVRKFGLKLRIEKTKVNMLHNLAVLKQGSGCCTLMIYCTAALTSFSDSISYVTYLFSEWRILISNYTEKLGLRLILLYIV